MRGADLRVAHCAAVPPIAAEAIASLRKGKETCPFAACKLATARKNICCGFVRPAQLALTMRDVGNTDTVELAKALASDRTVTTVCCA